MISSVSPWSFLLLLLFTKDGGCLKPEYIELLKSKMAWNAKQPEPRQDVTSENHNITVEHEITYAKGQQLVKNVQYTLFQKPSTWHEAQTYCKENGMAFASIRSETEAKLFEDELDKLHVGPGGSVWIGAGTTDCDGFYWTSDGQRITYNKWANREFDFDDCDEKCVSYYRTDWTGGQWVFYYGCYVNMYFGCERRE